MLDYLKGTVTVRDWIFVGAVLGLAVLLCTGFYFVVYTKQNERLAGLQKELDTVRLELKTAKEYEQNFEQLSQQSEKMELLVNLFQERLPEKREIPNLLRRFERLGDNIGLQVGLAPLPTISDADKETIPYTVTCRGDFHQVVTFINLLERDDRYLKVSDLDIGEEEAGVTEAEFTLSTFLFRQPQAGEPK